jgi:hypothetical protein
VADILNLLLDGQQRWDETDIERLLQPQLLPVPQLALPQIVKLRTVLHRLITATVHHLITAGVHHRAETVTRSLPKK